MAELGPQSVWVRTAPWSPQQLGVSLWTRIIIVWLHMMLGKYVHIDIYKQY